MCGRARDPLRWHTLLSAVPEFCPPPRRPSEAEAVPSGRRQTGTVRRRSSEVIGRETERGKRSRDSGPAISITLGSHASPLTSLDWGVPVLFQIAVVAKNNRWDSYLRTLHRVVEL